VIRARIDIDGVVDKPDVIGAVFGQTEGLLGEDLDLRELQRSGRIGRIQIAIKSEGGNSKGEIVIPVSLNKTATAILAAAIETVDRVGPCTARVTLEKLEDIRGAKRRKVVSRAISILKGWEEDISPGTEEITGEVTKASRRTVSKYGPDKSPAGPELMEGKEIIVVEGRADVINLMKSGIENTVAVEGTHVPKSIVDLTKSAGKTVIAFLDGDRGGDLILRELMQVAKIDYIARAPEGKEVEELTRREITKALQSKIPADQALALVSDRKATAAMQGKRTSRRVSGSRRGVSEADKPPRAFTESHEAELPRVAPQRERTTSRRSAPVDPAYVAKAQQMRESFTAALFDADKQVVGECSVADLAKIMESKETIDAVVFDGVVTQRLVDIAAKKKTSLLIGAAVADIESKPPNLRIVTFDDLGL
jgi:DNA primase